MEKVEKARQMAVAAHGDQKYGEHPYSVHLDEVARICEPFGEDAQVVAYLHDTLEDTALTYPDVEAAFGAFVAQCVAFLTDPPAANRKERKARSYAKLGTIDEKTPESLALIVKAADRLANVRASFVGRNHGLLDMYRKEHEAFRTAVHRPGLNDGLISVVDHLLAGSEKNGLGSTSHRTAS
jgi:(p)ppGpp synthase/HD superfamily hydrolase